MNRLHTVRTFHVKHYRQLILCVLMAALVASCTVSRSPVTGRKRAYAYTWEQEVQMGADADKQIQASYGFYDDDRLNQYVASVGQEVLANSDLRQPDTPDQYKQTDFHFRVLDSPIVNAFALPGGYVYVTRGLLAHLENEAQLGVVLGHEIGHVAARHASQRALEQQFGQLVLIGGAVAGQQILGVPAQQILNLGGTAAQLLFLSYSRDDEREADKLGVEYAAKTHYEAQDAADFFESLKRISQKEGQSIPNWMSTHPDPGEREQTIQQLAAKWQTTLQMNREEQSDLYNAIDGIVLGQNPRQGFTENGVFYHPEMRFSLPVPNGFQVVNEASQVGMVDPQQKAIEVLSVAQESSAKAAAQTFAQQQGIQVVESGAATSSGLPATYVLADAQTQDGQVVRLLAYYIEYNNQVFSILGYSLQSDFDAYRSEFLRSMRGFGKVTDSRILNVQPVKLKIEKAPRSAQFDAFVPSNLPHELEPEDVAIMNQLSLNASVSQGTLLKLPAS